ncbi:MAG TPA: hypothetical protein VK693_08495, partial [Steroidobacteraceae bacterium]|nr:hypothetical protein [Steroidobacteraceae bacterium]
MNIAKLPSVPRQILKDIPRPPNSASPDDLSACQRAVAFGPAKAKIGVAGAEGHHRLRRLTHGDTRGLANG